MGDAAGNEIASVLGRVVGGLPGGGEARGGQLEMAEAIGRGLARGRHVVVRAGTGTGKSLAYLVPAILSGKKVVVATATKNLQDQLAAKDLPLLAERLGRHFSFAVLKGRSNYLCLQRMQEAAVSGEQAELAEATGEGGRARHRPDRAAQIAELIDWAAETATGDRAELVREPEPQVWSAFSVTAEECPGAFRCPSGEHCFAEAARTKAAAADVVVVNLHLLGAHLASGGVVLPEHEALVVDEAHELEDVMSASLGVAMSPGRLRALAVTVRVALASGAKRRDRRSGPEGQPRHEVVDALFSAADDLEHALASRTGERLGASLEGELARVLDSLSYRLEACERELRGALDRSRSADGASADGDGAGSEQRLTRALLVAGRCREDLGRIAERDDDHVAWVEGGPRPSLELAPIDVSGILGPQLFEELPVVLTSATIPAGIVARLGAEAGQTDELDVGSPFEYGERSILYCAAHLPKRGLPTAEAAIEEELAALITAAGGRTLALFTSRAAMGRAAAAMRSRLSSPVLVQGEGGKQALVEAFSGDPAASLFATMGFWQGVDVPGATLSLVVIDRIPFPRPDEPLLQARRERAGPAAFKVIDLPRAASLLAQGAGRLIRSAEDRGVVAVLDSRLANASYRWELVRALPPMRRTKVRAEAEAFLRELHAEALATGS